MSGNANVTVAIPGRPNWDVWWWNGVENFQLDIVGFLAILGESAVLANAPVASLSRLFYLPRILPAPQALIRTSRPTALPTTPATVTGVHSGNVKEHIHFVANCLLGQEMEPYTVRCVKVTKKKQLYEPSWTDRLFRGQPRQATLPTNTADQGERYLSPVVKAKATGPLTWVTVLGLIEAVLLLTASIIFGDGMSIVATILLASLSTVIGAINKWTLVLPKRPGKHDAPPGDVVIRYPNGSYLVVRCEEIVARELYFAPEEIDYEITHPVVHRLLSLMGTVMLMLGVIALANAKLFLQVAWAGAYILSNIAQWTAAALPPSFHWDLSCYEVKEQGIEGGPKNGHFTEALWKAILLTRSTRWVKNGKAAPQTEVWDWWVSECEGKAKEYQSKYSMETLTNPIWSPDDDDEAMKQQTRDSQSKERQSEGSLTEDSQTEDDKHEFQQTLSEQTTHVKKGIVWKVPPEQEWDAKRAWDSLAKGEVSDPLRTA